MNIMETWQCGQRKKPPMLKINIIQSPKESGLDLALASSSCGFPVKVFPYLVDFLPVASEATGCLLVHYDALKKFTSDYQLQDSFFQYFKAYNSGLPVVVVVSNEQISDAVKLMRDGAYGVIDCKQPTKVFCQEINSAIESNRQSQQVDLEVKEALECYMELNDNEKDVLACYLVGYQAKQTATLLDIGRRTVDNRKNSFMNKFHSTSFPQLIRKVLLVEIHTGRKLSDRVIRLEERKQSRLNGGVAAGTELGGY